MNILIDIVFILSAYIVGSIPQLQILARLRHIQVYGDYHQSLWREAGMHIAAVGILIDLIKGAIPVIAGKYLGFDLTVVGIAGVAAVGGQMWPVFQKFDGEKGNTIGLAMAVALDYLPLLFSLIPIAIGAAIRTAPRIFSRASKKEAYVGGSYSRSLPLAMISGFIVLPFIAWYLKEPIEIVLAFAGLVILILVRRVTAGLKQDLHSGIAVKRVILDRLLYDRSAHNYRTPGLPECPGHSST